MKLTPIYTYQVPRQQPNMRKASTGTAPVNGTAEVSANSTPSNFQKGVGLAATTLNTIDLYNKLSGNSNQQGIDLGKNVENANNAFSANGSATKEQPTLQYSQPEYTPNESELSFLDQNYSDLREDSLVEAYNDDLAIPLRSVLSGENTHYALTKNADGTITGKGVPIQTNTGAVDSLGGQSWSMPTDSISIARMTLPIMQYASNYNTYDSKDKWLQGGKALQKVFQEIAGYSKDPTTGRLTPNKTILDDTGISNFVDATDMTLNWNNRTKYQNAMAGINTATNMIKNFNLQEYIGGEEAFGQVQDGVALLNFGSSVYNMSNNWDKMSENERIGAVLQTTLAGIQAYQGGQSLISSFIGQGAGTGAGSIMASQAVASTAGGGVLTAGGTELAGVASSAGGGTVLADGNVLSASGEVGTEMGSNVVASNKANALAEKSSGSLGAIGQGVAVAASLYGLYTGIKGMTKTWGTDSAKGRKAQAMNGSAIGAGIGTLIGGPVGAGIGAIVGALSGVCVGTINAGKSGPQIQRDSWRSTYENAGVFSKSDTGSHCMQLADGTWYDVGVDGKNAYATYANGTQKTWADASQFTDGKGTVRKMNPYDIDYTNGLDYMGSVMLLGMTLPMGGTAAKYQSKEAMQMIGYMTNGVTANCGREFTLSNFNIMNNNIKHLYSKIGIQDKIGLVDSVARAYATGKMTFADYNNALTASKVIYDSDGYDKAKALLASSNKAGVQPTNTNKGGN